MEQGKTRVVSEPPGETGLKFFGAVTASVSHDIKNRMAVINEQAGLLEDLVRMAERGRPLDPERLMRIADSVKSQIAMSDGIIRTMNRFAHSVDRLWRSEDLRELLPQVAALAKRTADNRGVHLQIRVPDASVRADTSPFYLMNLIWVCLDEAMRLTGKDGSVVLGCEKTPQGVSLRFTLDRFAEGAGDTTLPPAADRLALELSARVRVSAEDKDIRIFLPPDAGPMDPPAQTVG